MAVVMTVELRMELDRGRSCAGPKSDAVAWAVDDDEDDVESDDDAVVAVVAAAAVKD